MLDFESRVRHAAAAASGRRGRAGEGLYWREPGKCLKPLDFRRGARQEYAIHGVDEQLLAARLRVKNRHVTEHSAVARDDGQPDVGFIVLVTWKLRERSHLRGRMVGALGDEDAIDVHRAREVAHQLRKKVGAKSAGSAFDDGVEHGFDAPHLRHVDVHADHAAGHAGVVAQRHRARQHVAHAAVVVHETQRFSTLPVPRFHSHNPSCAPRKAGI